MNLQAELAALAAGFSGTLGLWARETISGEIVTFGAAGESFPSASTIKLAIFYELYRKALEGKVDLDLPWPLRAEDKVPGCGVLKDLTPGPGLPIRDLATLMMTISDNTATNLCIDVVGMDSVNRSMEELGLPGLRLYNKMYRPRPGGPLNQAVPSQLGQLMDRIVRHEVLTPEACQAMLATMKKVQGPFAPRFWPETVRLEKAESDQPPILAAKYGMITGTRNEVGAVWKGDRGYVYTIMTRDCADERWVEENEGQLLLSRAAAAVHRYFLGA